MSPEAEARLNAILRDLYGRAQMPTSKSQTAARDRDVGYACTLIGNLMDAEVARAAVPAPKTPRQVLAEIEAELEAQQIARDQAKARAKEDNHPSEENHQDGRWHGLGDALDVIRARPEFG